VRVRLSVKAGRGMQAGRGVQAGSYPVRRWPQVIEVKAKKKSQELKKAKRSLSNVKWMRKNLKVTLS
jgi:hypothetical protein